MTVLGTRLRLTAGYAVCVLLILCALAACSVPAGDPTTAPLDIPDSAAQLPEATPPAGSLGADEARTLASLVKVDDYPLYTMRYYGAYGGEVEASSVGSDVSGRWASRGRTPDWGCSLFAALAKGSEMLYGRNFDWRFSPALLLHTDPPYGYASVSMVDVAYLFEDGEVRRLEDLDLVELAPLLEAPGWPFDGLNEKGLVVGMAAVPSSPMPRDLEKSTISSLGVIREILDHAASVDQAVDILSSYNVDWSGGPALHYLVADRTGEAALIEYDNGEMVVLRNEEAWHMATNHLRTRVGPGSAAPCNRYATIEAKLETTGGGIGEAEAMDLLAQVSQPNTQWSVLYGLSTGNVRVVMGGEYADVDEFVLKVGD